MATDYRSLLSQPSEAVERPKPLPIGHYIGTLGQHEFGNSRQKQTPFVRFPIALESATQDVNPADLEGIDLSRKELRKDYFITTSALYRLTDMIDAVLGKKPGVNIDERLPDLRGQSVMIKVSQRENEQAVGEYFNDVDLIVAAP